MSQRSSGDGAADGVSDLEKALQYIEKQLGTLYFISIFRTHTPVQQGFPVLRPRWYASSLKNISCETQSMNVFEL